MIADSLWDCTWVGNVLGGEDLHVLPPDDAVGHEQNRDCVCRPSIELVAENDYLMEHSALDGRP